MGGGDMMPDLDDLPVAGQCGGGGGGGGDLKIPDMDCLNCSISKYLNFVLCPHTHSGGHKTQF